LSVIGLRTVQIAWTYHIFIEYRSTYYNFICKILRKQFNRDSIENNQIYEGLET